MCVFCSQSQNYGHIDLALPETRPGFPFHELTHHAQGPWTVFPFCIHASLCKPLLHPPSPLHTPPTPLDLSGIKLGKQK